MDPEKNSRDNLILRQEAADEALGIPRCGERYQYDRALTGWKQYDTDQDAHYFGVWVDLPGRRILTYAEGDRILVVCEDDDHLQAELASMAEFYGPPPPAFVVFQNGARINVFDPRPEVPAS